MPGQIFPLSDPELARYQRQLTLPGWGRETQLALKRKTVLVAGLGGLGSPACLYLAAAGVGQLILVDADKVELSNLNRQILHSTPGLGNPKAASGSETLRALNPEVETRVHIRRISDDSIADLAQGADLMLDCLDNFETRFVLNRHSLKTGIPFIHAAVEGLEGRLALLHPPATPCLRCLVPVEPPRPAPPPVLGATPGVMGALQALEALKFLTGLGEPLAGQLLVFDGRTMEFRKAKLSYDKDCVECGAFHK
jgi:adenylyltransferase/sulfurtransferase